MSKLEDKVNSILSVVSKLGKDLPFLSQQETVALAVRKAESDAKNPPKSNVTPKTPGIRGELRSQAPSLIH
jgi:hypothetical protein